MTHPIPLPRDRSPAARRRGGSAGKGLVVLLLIVAGAPVLGAVLEAAVGDALSAAVTFFREHLPEALSAAGLGLLAAVAVVAAWRVARWLAAPEAPVPCACGKAFRRGSRFCRRCGRRRACVRHPLLSLRPEPVRPEVGWSFQKQAYGYWTGSRATRGARGSPGRPRFESAPRPRRPESLPDEIPQAVERFAPGIAPAAVVDFGQEAVDAIKAHPVNDRRDRVPQAGRRGGGQFPLVPVVVGLRGLQKPFLGVRDVPGRRPPRMPQDESGVPGCRPGPKTRPGSAQARERAA